MRRFTAEYLDTTRAGMWERSRSALADLHLEQSGRILDVGAGTGELTAVLREESSEDVIALDADIDLLGHTAPPRVAGDATRLPFADDSVDLVVCQALLVNLTDPLAALEEFARVSRGRVAVIEPDNAAVSVESTIASEPDLAARAREHYVEGIDTDAALGDARNLFERAGLNDVTVRRYDYERTTAPPYSPQALTAARRKASGVGLEDDREAMLSGEMTSEEFETLREKWRAMGRETITQMQDREYRRTEIVPFYVTVGTVDES